jgi:hypothetical protein
MVLEIKDVLKRNEGLLEEKVPNLRHLPIDSWSSNTTNSSWILIHELNLK